MALYIVRPFLLPVLEPRDAAAAVLSPLREKRSPAPSQRRNPSLSGPPIAPGYSRSEPAHMPPGTCSHIASKGE